MPGWLPRLFSPPIRSSRRKSGVKTSVLRQLLCIDFGITPITVKVSPLSTSVRPTTPGSRPKRRSQKPSPSSATPRRSGLLLLRSERAADDRLLAERREDARGDLAPVDTLRLARGAARALSAAQDEVRPVVAHQRLEDAVLVPHVLEVRDGEAHLRHLLGPLGQEHQPLRLRVGQRPQQDGVDHAEDRGVGADPERERRDRDEREARRLPERARGEANVPPELFHWVPRGSVSGMVLGFET